MARRFQPLLLAVLLAACALPAAAGEPRPDRKVHSAGARTDTLSAPSREVYRVAILELEKNDWTIQRADSARGQIVTQWKKMDHPLTRLVFRDIQARCVVDVTALSATSTEVSFRGGLAGPEDLDHSAAFGLAQTAYRKAAERWIGRVRTTLAAPATAVNSNSSSSSR
jgi:hypothetical protein